MIIARAPHRLEGLLGLGAVIAALVAWIVYARVDLVLSHHDARAHLVVARRVLDSMTPGWRQLGTVWLPLPHLLLLAPNQVDLLYRTGAFASAVSVLAFGLTAWAAARLVRLRTGSMAGVLVATALLVSNPSLLYLSVTPLTEPLFIALIFVAILQLWRWASEPMDRPPAGLGLVLLCAAWTRYEAWPVLAMAIAVAAVARRQRDGATTRVIRQAGGLAVWPLAGVLLFVIYTKAMTGTWLVTEGFFVATSQHRGQPLRVAGSMWWALLELGGPGVRLVAAATFVFLAIRAWQKRHCADLVVLALVALLIVPAYALYVGHPFRLRFFAPAQAACALLCGVGVGLLDSRLRTSSPRLRRGLALAALLFVAAALVQRPPFDPRAPILAESREDDVWRVGRARVAACLRREYHGEKVLASMGALAPFMHDLTTEGMTIADFIHEGNGALWTLASLRPSDHVGWMLTGRERYDALARRVSVDPGLTGGMSRACEGGGVVLYRSEWVARSGTRRP